MLRAVLRWSLGGLTETTTFDVKVREKSPEPPRQPPCGFTEDEHRCRDHRHANDKGIDEYAQVSAKPSDFVVGSGEKMKLANTAI
jgi:hypothetical protein